MPEEEYIYEEETIEEIQPELPVNSDLPPLPCEQV